MTHLINEKSCCLKNCDTYKHDCIVNKYNIDDNNHA